MEVITMKFRNKKTGAVFEHTSTSFCGEYKNNGCKNCPIYFEWKNERALGCNFWVETHPITAGELMNYDIVFGNDSRTIKLKSILSLFIKFIFIKFNKIILQTKTDMVL